MFQESVSPGAESAQRQSYVELTDSMMVDSDDHKGSSHSAEQFGIGLSLGFLLGGVADVIDNSLPTGVMLGLTSGVVPGVYFIECRRRRATWPLQDLLARKIGRLFRYGRCS